jgi:hypothetical protein
VCRRKSRLLKTGTPDKHVDVCVESDEDRGSTPLASTLLILSYLRFNTSWHRNADRNKSEEICLNPPISVAREFRPIFGTLCKGACASRLLLFDKYAASSIACRYCGLKDSVVDMPLLIELADTELQRQQKP